MSTKAVRSQDSDNNTSSPAVEVDRACGSVLIGLCVDRVGSSELIGRGVS